MASQTKTQKAVIGKGYQQLPVIGPSAGVDLRTSPTLLPPERARTLVNFSLEEPGALVVRPGFTGFSTTSLGNNRLQGGARVYLNTATPNVASTTFTLAAYQGAVYGATDGGVWSAALLSNLSPTNEIYFPADRDLVAAMDGSTSPWKSTNGSSWTHMGIAAGTAAGTASSAAFSNGLSTSEFELSYTYKDRDLAYESNGSTALSTITIQSTANGAISYVVANSTDPQVDAIVVYARNKTSAEPILRKVSSQAQSGGANSTIVVNSSAWTTNDEIPTDHTPPTALSFGVVWKNRWWARDASRTNRLKFTQIFQPQSWPGLYYIDIPFERGDAIQALVPIGDSLLVFGSTKIFTITGQTSLDFEVRPTIASQDGAFGPRAACAIENGVVHAGASGVYIFDGYTDKLLSFDLDPGWRDLVKNASAAALGRIALVYHQQRKELRVAVPRLYPTATGGEWVLDLNRTRQSGQPAWTATDRDIVGYIPWDGPETTAGNRGRLLSWNSGTGFLFEEATGTSANSSNLTAQYEGPGLTLGTFRGRWTDVRGEYEPHSGSFSIEPLVDGVSMGTQAVAIGAGLSVFDTAIFDSATFAGSGRRQFQKMLPLNSDGRTFVLKMTYSGQEPFRLYTYAIGLVPETRSRDFSE